MQWQEKFASVCQMPSIEEGLFCHGHAELVVQAGVSGAAANPSLLTCNVGAAQLPTCPYGMPPTSAVCARSHPGKDDATVHVGKLPAWATDADLLEVMAPYGFVKHGHVIPGAGYGFITFADPEVAASLVHCAEHHLPTLNGMLLTVSSAFHSAAGPSHQVVFFSILSLMTSGQPCLRWTACMTRSLAQPRHTWHAARGKFLLRHASLLQGGSVS